MIMQGTHLQGLHQVLIETGDDIGAGDGHPLRQRHGLVESARAHLLQGLHLRLQVLNLIARKHFIIKYN